jgi:uncharacterized protein YlxP (DUF503 family)
MVVAVAVFGFHIPGCRGLKEKRAFVRPLKARIRGEFEISAAEVAYQDLLQRAAIGVAAAGADRESVEPLMARVVAFVERFVENEGAELTDVRQEILEYGDVGEAEDGLGAREEGR